MSSYLFYDIETTGLNAAFDQILQFAAIRTDLNFHEIERYHLQVRLRPDVVVSPHALLTHRIPISDSLKGVCEYEAVYQIYSWLNAPGTISLGYNSLGFDDEFLRFCFYRNLLPPYTHQYANGCSRMDLLPITVIYRLYREEILQWPHNGSQPTLKLEHLNAANQLASGQAHDAMVDVEATLALAARLAVDADMWNYLGGYFDKSIDTSRLSKLPIVFESQSGPHQQGLLVGSEFGPKRRYQVPVISLGTSIPYRKQTLWLRLDLPELRQAAPDNIDKSTWVVRKKMGEPNIILPLRKRYWQHIDAERQAQTAENLCWLQAHPTEFRAIIEHHRNFAYPLIPDLDADAALYQNGFPTRKTQDLCRRFHQVDRHRKTAMVAEFDDPDTRTLALRLLGRNYPQELPRKLTREFGIYLRRIDPPTPELAIVDHRSRPRTTPRGALELIERLNAEPPVCPDQTRLLAELGHFLRRQFDLKS